MLAYLRFRRRGAMREAKGTLRRMVGCGSLLLLVDRYYFFEDRYRIELWVK